MVSLVNHPGLWLNDPAAASLERYERDHGVQQINSAGRTVAEQQALIDRWDQGGWQNRPPYLYEPKRPATAGTHTSGNALDVGGWRAFLATAAAYGWVQVYSWDVVHFEYSEHRDQHINDPAPASADATPLTPEGEEDEEEDMAMKGAHYKVNGQSVYMLFNEVSGFYVEHSGVDGGYNNSLAKNWDTGTWPEISEKHAVVIKRSLDAIRRTAVTGSLRVDIDG